MRVTFAVFCALAASAAASVAVATPASVATNMVGVTTRAAPPAGFDAAHASAAALAAYGMPPRPDATQSPADFALWSRAMQRATHRIVPHLVRRPARHDGDMPVRGDYSKNWAGALMANFSTSFQTGSFQQAYTNFNAPSAAEPIGQCSGGWLYSAEWTGLDGWGSTDVLQAGFEADEYCDGRAQYPRYYSWFEWYPADGYEVSNFTVNPGQEVFVAVWATSAVAGNVWIENVTTGASTVMQVAPKAGITLTGNSVEWVVERPTVKNVITNLDRFSPVTFNAFARDGWGREYYPNQPAPYTFEDTLTMLGNSGNPVADVTLNSAQSFTVTPAGTAY